MVKADIRPSVQGLSTGTSCTVTWRWSAMAARRVTWSRITWGPPRGPPRAGGGVDRPAEAGEDVAGPEHLIAAGGQVGLGISVADLDVADERGRDAEVGSQRGLGQAGLSAQPDEFAAEALPCGQVRVG